MNNIEAIYCLRDVSDSIRSLSMCFRRVGNDSASEELSDYAAAIRECADIIDQYMTDYSIARYREAQKNSFNLLKTVIAGATVAERNSEKSQ